MAKASLKPLSRLRGGKYQKIGRLRGVPYNFFFDTGSTPRPPPLITPLGMRRDLSDMIFISVKHCGKTSGDRIR